MNIDVNSLPYCVASDTDGNIFEIPPFRMTGRSLMEHRLPQRDELVSLPFGSNLYMLPDRHPVAFDPGRKEFVVIENYEGIPIHAVAAFMAPAYMQTLMSAWVREGHPSPLPLYSYTAVGWKDDRFLAAGHRIDDDIRQDPECFDHDLINKGTALFRKRFGKNRLALHLIDNCVCKYGCPAARNWVLNRWEAPLPTSPYCNSRCLGCISCQPEESGVVSSQSRITFVPDPEDIARIAIQHLETAERPVVSFGQGCEGEPLLAGDVLVEAVRLIRRSTGNGVINLNTNGSKPDVVERLCKAGLDSIRVSLNSAREEYYNRYYKPNGYSFRDVLDTFDIVKRNGKWTSINYFIFPGFTDQEDEMKPLFAMIEKYNLDMIQTRNLNIDPDWYIDTMELNTLFSGTSGMLEWKRKIKRYFPNLVLGYFNPSLHKMSRLI